MAQRKADYPLVKHTLNLFEGDWNYLQSIYPLRGASRVIRDLVRSHINRIKNQTGPRPSVELDMSEIDLGDDHE